MLDPCFNHTKIYFLTFLRNFICAKNNACDTEQISKKNLKEKEKLCYVLFHYGNLSLSDNTQSRVQFYISRYIHKHI